VPGNINVIVFVLLGSFREVSVTSLSCKIMSNILFLILNLNPLALAAVFGAAVSIFVLAIVAKISSFAIPIKMWRPEFGSSLRYFVGQVVVQPLRE
jgi:hypothetical protein